MTTANSSESPPKVHYLPETFKGPPARNRALGEYPPNVVNIRPAPPKRETVAVPPTVLMMRAMLNTLEKRKGFKTIRDCTFRTLCAMLDDFEEDVEVRASVREAINLMCSTSTARW